MMSPHLYEEIKMKLKEITNTAIKIIGFYLLVIGIMNLIGPLINIKAIIEGIISPWAVIIPIIENIIYLLVFIYSSQITNILIKTDTEITEFTNSIFRGFIIKITLYLTGIITIINALIYLIRGIYMLSVPMNAYTDQLLAKAELQSNLAANIITLCFGIILYFIAIRINIQEENK